MERFPIDGSISLADQQTTLRFIEMAGPFKLITYQSKTVDTGSSQKVNLASFESAAKVPPGLALVQLGGANNAVSLIASELAAGKRVVFHENVFVEGNPAEVIGFR